MQSPLYTSRNPHPFPLQNTPGAALLEISTSEISTSDRATTAANGAAKVEESEQDVWDVWPYCWITAAWSVACSRFHSLHTNLWEWRLARHNRRLQQKFQSSFWQIWRQQNADPEAGLRLL